jgi:hypothetical protein
MISAGCVSRQVLGETTIHSIESWVVVVTALGATAVIVAGWLLRRSRKRIGIAVMAAAILVLVTTVPGLALSRSLVDPEHVDWSHGFKFTSIRFYELDEIDHTIKRIPIGMSIQYVHYLDFRKKTGEVIHVQVEPRAGLHLQEAIPEIIRRARARGVVASPGQPQGPAPCVPLPLWRSTCTAQADPDHPDRAHRRILFFPEG